MSAIAGVGDIITNPALTALAGAIVTGLLTWLGVRTQKAPDIQSSLSKGTAELIDQYIRALDLSRKEAHEMGAQLVQLRSTIDAQSSDIRDMRETIERQSTEIESQRAEIERQRGEIGHLNGLVEHMTEVLRSHDIPSPALRRATPTGASSLINP